MVSPPKPWEKATASEAASIPPTFAATSAISNANAISSSTTDGDPTKSLSPPARPSSQYPATTTNTPSLGGVYGGTTSPHSTGYGNTYGGYGGGYGGGAYGGYGGGYGSGYGSGGLYSGGGYGGGYGGYTGAYTGLGSTGMGFGMGYPAGSRFGRFGDPQQPPLPPQPPGAAISATQAAFQLLEQIVFAFGGLAQMLESTYFATHSSFLAMLGVAQHFSHLREYLGQVLNVWALGKSVREFMRIGGGGNGSSFLLDPQEFLQQQQQQQQTQQPGALEKSMTKKQAVTRFSKVPLLVFLVVVFGAPYLMVRLLQRMQRQRQPPREALTEDAQFSSTITANQQQVEETKLAGMPPPTTTTTPTVTTPTTTPSLRFARALYDFEAQNPQEISFRAGDIVGILSMDPQSEWWRGKIRQGPIGYFPNSYVALMEPAQSGVETSGKGRMPVDGNAVEPSKN